MMVKFNVLMKRDIIVLLSGIQLMSIIYQFGGSSCFTSEDIIEEIDSFKALKRVALAYFYLVIITTVLAILLLVLGANDFVVLGILSNIYKKRSAVSLLLGEVLELALDITSFAFIVQSWVTRADVSNNTFTIFDESGFAGTTTFEDMQPGPYILDCNSRELDSSAKGIGWIIFFISIIGVISKLIRIKMIAQDGFNPLIGDWGITTKSGRNIDIEDVSISVAKSSESQPQPETASQQ
jgi:hypothetical protein